MDFRWFLSRIYNLPLLSDFWNGIQSDVGEHKVFEAVVEEVGENSAGGGVWTGGFDCVFWGGVWYYDETTVGFW